MNICKNIALKTDSVDKPLIFLIFNTACFGDVLLCNSLCQNIKHIFNNSRIVFVVDKKWVDVAKYQDGVDDVIVLDKQGVHKGFWGFLKFIKDFKYKKIFASVITYKNERNYLLARILGSKHILMSSKPLSLSTQEKHNHLLTQITNEQIINYPIKFNLPTFTANYLSEQLVPEEKYIVLCCISKNPVKDMPLCTAIELVKVFNRENIYKIVIVGTGNKTLKYSMAMEKAGCNFINLVNKTSILELGQVIKASQGVISVDTGTMHYAYSLSVPTVAVFYEQDKVQTWAPNSDIYNVKVVTENFSAENISYCFKNLLEEHKNV